MKKRMRTRKSLNVKKRVVGFFAIAVILLGVIGGFGLTHVIAESNSTTGGGADRSAPVAVVASKSESTSGLLGGGGTNANVVLNSDNTGDSTGSENKVQNTGYETPSVNVNNMSSYPQTGDAHDTGLIITGFSILIGLFAFYGYKLRKSLVVLHVSKVSK
ncbi:LPXTG cell wall anchor domain-containing protein [Companilactobacillus farciminis]|uniref:LPXTG cell wall anchor domain-containing protein n=1 Tax=Companilactobacillus farciminis TaxID=1612 RepID=UPI001914EF09|nr:LPXTG cell wall anchor domain-containing protein [Companilactobacillus farciminis]